MGTVVLGIILAAIAVIAIKSYMKKLSGGCCGSGGDAIEYKVTDQDISHYPYCARLAVFGMHCAHCKKNVENAFHSRDGMWAEADLDGQCVTVRMKQKLTDWEIRQIISGIGYTPGEIEWKKS